MFDRLGNNELTQALDELIACLGVNEELATQDLTAFLRKKETEKCIQEIAARLGLPIRIQLSFVPNDFKAGNSDGFHSTALARTDWTGHGKESITAQVNIPPNLPMFGTSGLQGYPIRVRVSENCHAHPDTFVAIMAHELSHILLACLWSPHKDSELHTDLVPILLGFRDAVRRGRKHVESTSSGNLTTTTTTTYGYLTDAQFEFACSYVKQLLHRHAADKARLLKLAGQVRGKIDKAARSLASFRDCYGYLDSHPVRRMKQEHAERMVRLHGNDESREWESRIAAVRKRTESSEAFGRTLKRFTTVTVDDLKSRFTDLELASTELDQVSAAITKDERMLRKYVGFRHRLQRFLHPQS